MLKVNFLMKIIFNGYFINCELYDKERIKIGYYSDFISFCDIKNIRDMNIYILDACKRENTKVYYVNILTLSLV